jgi:hypothetical protein
MGSRCGPIGIGLRAAVRRECRRLAALKEKWDPSNFLTTTKTSSRVERASSRRHTSVTAFPTLERMKTAVVTRRLRRQRNVKAGKAYLSPKPVPARGEF